MSGFGHYIFIKQWIIIKYSFTFTRWMTSDYITWFTFNRIFGWFITCFTFCTIYGKPTIFTPNSTCINHFFIGTTIYSIPFFRIFFKFVHIFFNFIVIRCIWKITLTCFAHPCIVNSIKPFFSSFSDTIIPSYVFVF